MYINKSSELNENVFRQNPYLARPETQNARLPYVQLIVHAARFRHINNVLKF